MDDWRKRHNVALDEQRAAYLDVDEADKLWPHAREEFYAAMAQANSKLSNAKRKMEALWREMVEANPHPQ